LLDGLDEVANPEDRQLVVDEVERLTRSVQRADMAAGRASLANALYLMYMSRRIIPAM